MRPCRALNARSKRNYVGAEPHQSSGGEAKILILSRPLGPGLPRHRGRSPPGTAPVPSLLTAGNTSPACSSTSSQASHHLKYPSSSNCTSLLSASNFFAAHTIFAWCARERYSTAQGFCTLVHPQDFRSCPFPGEGTAGMIPSWSGGMQFQQVQVAPPGMSGLLPAPLSIFLVVAA